MNKKQYAPGTRNECAGAIDSIDKDNQISLGYHQRRVYNLLCQGGQYSVADLSAALRLSDPRSQIRNLRSKGIAIADIWCNAVHGSRFKRYFIRGGFENNKDKLVKEEK